MKRARDGVAVIVLAAGTSSRFQGSKLTTPLSGRPLLEWSILAADEAGFSCKVIITRPDFALALTQDWKPIENQDFALGMASSIRIGIEAVRQYDRAVIMLGDMPMVTWSHLVRLANAEGVAFTRYPNGRKGCPAAFPREASAQLLTLTGEEGAASLEFPAQILFDPDVPDMLFDVDTKTEMQSLERRWEPKRKFGD